MLAALIIVFREVLEAGLIVGVILAASRGVAGSVRAVVLGTLAGIAGAVVVALFAAKISSAFDGRGLELFSAAVLLLAVVMLTWHVVWMSDHARELTQRLRALGKSVGVGGESVAVLGIAAGSAVMREGSEAVLFISGIALQNTDTAAGLAVGSAAGLGLGALVSAAIYFGLSAIPLRWFFTATGALVTMLAAGLAAEAVHQLSNAGLVSPLLDTTLWNSSWLLADDSFVGRLVHVLLGYRDHPTALEATVYVATIAGIVLLARYQHAAAQAASARKSAQGLNGRLDSRAERIST
jgi:high-affinity iron transporter